MFIGPQPGPQERFLASEADVAIYGGAAGAGKTFALLLEPLRHALTNPDFNATFFRRTAVQIRNPGGLWDESMRLYAPIPGVKPLQQPLEWHFPRGGKVKFAGLELETSVLDWQGSQIPLICCQEDELVRMADGTLKAVKDIAVGDMVQTLQGARPILAVGGRRLEECVNALVRDASQSVIAKQVHSVTHKVLTTDGWLSYADMCGEPRRVSSFWSTLRRCARKCAGLFGMKFQSGGPLLGSPPCCRAPRQEPFGSPLGRQCESASAACEAQLVPGSDCAASGCEHQAPRRLSSVTRTVALHEPTPHPVLPTSSCPASPADEAAYVRCGSGSVDSRGRCWSSRCHDGEHARVTRGSSLSGVLRQACAAARTRMGWPSDGLGKVQTNTPHKARYAHPYRQTEQISVENVRLGSCEMAPCGKHWVVDLTVKDDSHYITNSGLVNKNCFDELTHFSASQFWYLLSRNRSMSGVSGYVRATCNPDADSWVAELIAWWIDQSTGFPIPERAAVVRYFVRVSDKLYWADSPDELRAHHPGAIPKSLTFVPAKLADNQALMAADPGYLANLMAMPGVERARLLDGNWKVRPAAGLYFNRQWVRMVDAPPANLREVRGWDMAATPKTETNDPDWTCGTKMGQTAEKRCVVSHHVFMRGGPDAVLQLVKRMAQIDGRNCTISIPQDPGQAGVSQVNMYARDLAGYRTHFSTESRASLAAADTANKKSAKISRFGAFSAQAERGMVDVVKGDWNDRWFTMLESFPDATHDDDADSTARAYNTIIDMAEPARTINFNHMAR